MKSLQPRPSKEIHYLNQRLERGRCIAQWIGQDGNNWLQLSTADQRIWANYTNGSIGQRITALRMQQQQQHKFPGVAEVVVQGDRGLAARS